jgi:uncharacterized protein (TIGR00730 family)
MKVMKLGQGSHFADSPDGLGEPQDLPKTDPGAPPTASNLAQRRSSSYQLAFEDLAFLRREDMRDVRFQLEYAKADTLLREWGIRSTLIVFGSARIPSPEQAQALCDAATTPEEKAYAAARATQTPWYDAAREFGRIVSERGGAFAPRNRWRDNVIATGGGPGAMEAANRGAFEIGAPSIGFNITLPTEQEPNPYTTPELTFQFHYFALRKMHLAIRANALVVFPGGFGTLDELFEILTLEQTGRAQKPVVLFDKAYWSKLINFDHLVDQGMVAAKDLDLFTFADTPEEIWSDLVKRGVLDFPMG